jgi:all-trans-retinol 13,14-reductase
MAMDWTRRDFVKTLLASLPFMGFDWSLLPRAAASAVGDDTWDAIIIGSGLGGLACAAAFARQGFRPLVLEQHDRPGGYATTFKRPGGFEFDVSLHSTAVTPRDGDVYDMIPGFPEIQGVEFVPHPTLYRAIFPEHDLVVPNRAPDKYIAMLKERFPDEAAGIDALFAEMQGVVDDVGKLSAARGQVDYSRFPVDFPHLMGAYTRTWGQMQDAHLKSPKLRAIVSALWGYYGLPPSQLASIYFAMPTIGYLQQGGFYPRGKSQAISNAFVSFIESHGGKVLLGTRVERILVKDGAAYGVGTASGKQYEGKAVVANANVYDTFHKLLEDDGTLKDYHTRLDTMRVSLSSFQVFLGLKKDLVKETGLVDSEFSCENGYDPEAAFRAALAGSVEDGSFGLTLYDNIYPGYSPPGKNTLSIITLHGYDYWKKYETDYLAGKKDAYHAEKERLADALVAQVEKKLMPGLRQAIEVREVATPLTNLHYTSNYRGAIYGWDQTLDNAMPKRLPQSTPVKNLYLASAWTQPGGGYSGVIWSGIQCFGEVMRRRG